MDAWLALHSTIWKTLDYHLSATILSRDQRTKIIRPALEVGLTRSHIRHYFPRAFIHAPAKSLGAGRPDLYSVQGLSNLESIASHSVG
jgi:hypothetical protein